MKININHHVDDTNIITIFIKILVKKLKFFMNNSALLHHFQYAKMDFCSLVDAESDTIHEEDPISLWYLLVFYGILPLFFNYVQFFFIILLPHFVHNAKFSIRTTFYNHYSLICVTTYQKQVSFQHKVGKVGSEGHLLRRTLLINEVIFCFLVNIGK